MSRIVLAALAAALLALPATAGAHSDQRLRGIVTAEDAVRSIVTVSSARRDHVLRVQHSALQRIRVGMRVELRGKTLRRHGNGSRVLSTNVLHVRSEPQSADRIRVDDDELEVKGTLTSLSPLTVVAHGNSFTCAVPTGESLTGFAVGDFVEITCDLSGDVFVLRELELEDDDEGIRDDDEDEDQDNSGPGNADDDDDDDNSGPGNGNEDDDDDDDEGDDEDDGGDRGPGGGDDGD